MDPPRNEPHPLHAASVAEDAGALTDHPPALVEATLQRLLASDTFGRSRRHREFLDHVVRAALAGERDRLKEVIIGIEVFGRSVTDFDPRRDPIVRVEAGRIRAKLARFYDGEGAGEAFGIALPVGNYLPRLVHRRSGAAPATARSLAVLPFANLSGDPDDASFSLGLADLLIDALGRMAGHKVIARPSALKARDAGMDLKAIGKLLGVEHVVEGSLQRSGARLRCIAQLSNTRDSVRLWSKRFEHDTDRGDDLFQFQDEIVHAILAAVSALQPSAPGAVHAAHDSTRLMRGRPPVRAARELFERGREAARHGTPETYATAIVLFERAVELDPGFARAHSQLAAAYANRHGLVVEPTFPTFANVERAAHRALELDPLDGEARALLATIAHRIDYRWHEAEPMFRDALRLAPNSTRVHTAYAWGLVFDRRGEEALRQTGLARELDPLNTRLRAEHAAIAMYAGEHEPAIEALRAVLRIEPGHLFSRVMLGIAHLAVGEPDEASTHFDHILRLVPDHATSGFSRLCATAMRGDGAAARGELDALLERLADRHYSRVDLAMTQACLGDLDGALASVMEAGEARDLQFIGVPVHPLFEPLRADPRFEAIGARYGIGAAVRPTTATIATPPGRGERL